MDRRYQYYAVVTEDFPHVEEPALVCRRWTDEHGIAHEEAFIEDLVWAPEVVLSNVEAGRWAGEIHPITEEAGLRFEAIQYARVHEYDPPDGKYDYFALVEDGKPVLAIRTWISPQGFHMEETHTRSGWLTSYVRSKVERSSTAGELVPITQEEAEKL